MENGVKSNIKVSIITVCYNSELTIKDTIESVLYQTYPNIEYVIVDGKSTDATVELIRKYEPLFHGRMKYISERDKGIYNAMNKGIRMSSGSLLGILNSDDFYELDAVEIVVNHMNNAQCQVLYGYMQVLRENNKIYISKENHKNLKNEMIPHPTCFITRSVYQKYGLFLEWFKVAADYELMLRMYKDDEVIFTQVQRVISSFRLGGVSNHRKYLLEREIARVMHGAIPISKFAEKALLFLLDQFA